MVFQSDVCGSCFHFYINIRFQMRFLSQSTTCRKTNRFLNCLQKTLFWVWKICQKKEIWQKSQWCDVSLPVRFWHERMKGWQFSGAASVYTLQSVRQKNRDADQPSNNSQTRNQLNRESNHNDVFSRVESKQQKYGKI